MTVQITPECEQFVQQLVAQGAYSSNAAVVDEALRLLKHRDELRAEIRRGLDELDRGERITDETAFGELRTERGRSAD